jgi:hypothetical protein
MSWSSLTLISSVRHLGWATVLVLGCEGAGDQKGTIPQSTGGGGIPSVTQTDGTPGPVAEGSPVSDVRRPPSDPRGPSAPEEPPWNAPTVEYFAAVMKTGRRRSPRRRN